MLAVPYFNFLEKSRPLHSLQCCPGLIARPLLLSLFRLLGVFTVN